LKALLSTSLNRNGIVGYPLTTRDGRVLADSASFAGQRLDSPLEQDLLQRSLIGPRYAQITLPLNWPRGAVFMGDGPVLIALAAVWPRRAELEPGVLWLVIDPRTHFDDIFLRARIGHSGETCAVTPEGRFATPSRFDSGRRDRGLRVAEAHAKGAAPLAPSTDPDATPLTRAAREIVAGRSGGSLEGCLDDRGVEVVGLWQWDAERGFGVVTEVDVAGAFTSVQRQWRQSIATALLILALVGALGALLATARRRAVADAALLQERERRIAEQLSFRSALLEAIPNPVFVRGPDTRLLDCNRAYEQAYGVRKEDVLGTRVGDLDYLDPQAREQYQDDAEWLIRSGGQRSSEPVERWADGRPRTVLYQRQAFDLPDGRRGGMIGVLTDIRRPAMAKPRPRWWAGRSPTSSARAVGRSIATWFKARRGRDMSRSGSSRRRAGDAGASWR
jgi:PAS domain S-box-containing protein